MARLAVVPAADIEILPASVATWVLASKLAMDLVARERVVPTISRRGGRIEARWAAALAGSEDASKVAAIANDDAAARLRRIVGPFILRRLKSDPTIIQDLPPKNEMKVVCTLTREQATLYKAVVDEELRRIESSDGIERRGRVLALLMFTKQICNHPAQYLGETGPLPKRSGKLARTTRRSKSRQ